MKLFQDLNSFFDNFSKYPEFLEIINDTKLSEIL